MCEYNDKEFIKEMDSFESEAVIAWNNFNKKFREQHNALVDLRPYYLRLGEVDCSADLEPLEQQGIASFYGELILRKEIISKVLIMASEVTCEVKRINKLLENLEDNGLSRVELKD